MKYDMHHEMLTQLPFFALTPIQKRARWVSNSWFMSHLLWFGVSKVSLCNVRDWFPDSMREAGFQTLSLQCERLVSRLSLCNARGWFPDSLSAMREAGFQTLSLRGWFQTLSLRGWFPDSLSLPAMWEAGFQTLSAMPEAGFHTILFLPIRRLKMCSPSQWIFSASLWRSKSATCIM